MITGASRKTSRRLIARAVLAAALVVPAGFAPALAHARTQALAASPRAGTPTGALVIGVEPNTSAAVALKAEKAGARVVERQRTAGFIVVRPAGGVSRDRLAKRLGGLPGVRYAQLETYVHASFVPNDPGFPEQWNMSAVGAPDAWDVEQGSASVKVAVVDTGVDLANRDLVGRLDTAHDKDYVDGDDVAQDESVNPVYSHGTHVAGIIAANINNGIDVAGLSPHVMILPIRVLDANGSGTDPDLALGIRYAADQGVRVINLSLGGPSDSQVVFDAVNYALAKGCLIVAASGNEGQPTLNYPAAYPDVVSVGSITSTLARSGFSNYGSGLDFVAPGSSVLSLQRGGGTFVDSGTSMAVPHVTAAAALLASRYTTWTASMIELRLKETAQRLNASVPDYYTGYGLVRADRALGVGTPPPLPPSDDDVPGMPVATSPQVGTVDAATDPHDVFGITLAQNQTVMAWLKGPAGAVTELSLLGPDAASVMTATPRASVISTGVSAKVVYEAPEGGAYYLDVHALSGSGTYQLAWLRGYSTAIGSRAPSSVTWGSAVKVTGTVTGGDGTAPQWLRVELDAKPAGAVGWTLGVAHATTGADGTYTLTHKPARPTTYRVRFAGIPGRLSAVGRSLPVSVRAYLTAPVPQSSVRVGRYFRAAGTLRPQAAASSGTVSIVAYRYRDGAWRGYRAFTASNTAITGATRYSARVMIPSSGRWKLVAKARATSRYAATSSAPVFVDIP